MKAIITSILVLYCMMAPAQKAGHYRNPILGGFYPDPSICRAGNDYYIVNSSFAWYPGLPLFHSRDLVNWQQIGHAMNRPSQLNLDSAGVSRGLFAPAISYHKGIFYIVCTLIDKGGNFVITAKDPRGPWSEPVWLKEVDGIDPSLFFDENDTAWLVYNKSLWDGHRTIRMRRFDHRNLRVEGEEKLLVNGGVDISKKPVWIEGPHIYKINGWYYLLCAEGGTAYNHSEVVFRSRSVEGPFQPYEHNPILTQRHLDPNRKNPITTTGHADLVEAPNGGWYAIFLGCRPYEGGHFNTGRETFMAPVSWTKDGWPVITKGQEEVKYFYPLPKGTKWSKGNAFSGNFTFNDDFTQEQLNQRYTFLRTVRAKWYSTMRYKGNLTLSVRPETVGGEGNPSFVGFRQQHLKCVASTSVILDAKAEHEKAGLAIFQSEHHYYFLCRSVEQGRNVVQLYQSTPGKELKLLASQAIPAGRSSLGLKIEARGDTYVFSYSADEKKWAVLKDGVDAKFLSTETAGGFVGCVFGLYATSQEQPSTNEAVFMYFKYQGKDSLQ
jgi:xylan 1,4-beta-xylosidase